MAVSFRLHDRLFSQPHLVGLSARPKAAVNTISIGMTIHSKCGMLWLGLHDIYRGLQQGNLAVATKEPGPGVQPMTECFPNPHTPFWFQNENPTKIKGQLTQ